MWSDPNACVQLFAQPLLNLSADDSLQSDGLALVALVFPILLNSGLISARPACSLRLVLSHAGCC